MAGLNVGTVVAKFSADVTDLRRGITQAKNEVATLGGHFQSVGGGIKSFFSTAGQQAQALTRTMGLLGAAGAAGIGLLGKAAVTGAADFEQTKIALTTMMGSAEDAGNLLQDIAKFAAETPFEMPELATTTKQLMAFGFSADEAVSGMKTLGDISAGLNVPIGDLAYLLGTLKAQGRAMTIDIRQFAMRGLPIYDSLASVMKVSKEKVSELVEAGKVGFPEVNKALELMVAEGGKFHGSMAAQATSLKGLYSTLSDVMGFTLREIIGINLKGEVREGSIFDILRKKSGALIEFLDSKKESIAAFFTKIIEGIGGIYNLIVNGDFTGAFGRLFGIDEDAPIVGIILSIRDAFISFWEWIVANQETVLTFLKGLAIAFGAIMIVTTVASAIAALTSPIGLIIMAIALLYTAWTQNWGGIQEKTAAVWAWMQEIMAEIKAGWDEWGVHIWNSVKATFMTVWNIIKFVVQLITDTITVFILFFNGEWGAMWEAIKTGAQHALDNIKGIFGNAWEAIKEGITGIYNHFVGKFTEMWNKAKEIAENIRHAISDAFDKDKHNSPSIADRVNELKGFVERNSFGFTPNVVPSSAGTVNQTINAQINNGVDLDFLGRKMQWMMRNQY